MKNRETGQVNAPHDSGLYFGQEKNQRGGAKEKRFLGLVWGIYKGHLGAMDMV